MLCWLRSVLDFAVPKHQASRLQAHTVARKDLLHMFKIVPSEIFDECKEAIYTQSNMRFGSPKPIALTGAGRVIHHH